MAFGEEYSSNDAYFIAGGATLAVIEKYETDRANTQGMQAAIAKEYGAKKFTGFASSGYLVFENPVTHPALLLEEVYKSGEHVYRPNRATPEGKALQAKFDDVPEFDLTQEVFARRLTGVEKIATNPDDLQQNSYGSGGHWSEKNTATAASFTKYGEYNKRVTPEILATSGRIET